MTDHWKIGPDLEAVEMTSGQLLIGRIPFHTDREDAGIELQKLWTHLTSSAEFSFVAGRRWSWRPLVLYTEIPIPLAALMAVYSQVEFGDLAIATTPCENGFEGAMRRLEDTVFGHNSSWSGVVSHPPS